MLPISSRSFHSDAEFMKRQIAELQNQQRHSEELLARTQQTLEQTQETLARLNDMVQRREANQKAHYLIAEPGYPNYGDEIIAAEWLRYLAKIDPHTPVIIDCMRPGPSTALLRKQHPHVTVTDTIARLTIENPVADGNAAADVPVQDVAATIVAALEDEGRAARLASGIRLLNRDVATIHVLGGGYMNSPWVANLARLAAPQWGMRHGIPSIGTGVGIVPLYPRDQQYVRDVAQSMVAFTCRDEKSVRAIDPTGHANIVALAPDDCFVNGLSGLYDGRRGAGFAASGHPDGMREMAEGQRAHPDWPASGSGVERGMLPRTMLCIQKDFVEDQQALFHHVIAVLEAWQVDKEKETLGIVECIPYECLELIAFLNEAGYRTELFPTQVLIDDGFPAAPGQRWLSTRYHPHLLAAAVGASGCYLSVRPGYYDVKHEAVLRMGSRWNETSIEQPIIPQPGEGFAHPDVRFAYRDEIRRTAAAVYGM